MEKAGCHLNRMVLLLFLCLKSKNRKKSRFDGHIYVVLDNHIEPKGKIWYVFVENRTFAGQDGQEIWRQADEIGCLREEAAKRGCV